MLSGFRLNGSPTLHKKLISNQYKKNNSKAPRDVGCSKICYCNLFTHNYFLIRTYRVFNKNPSQFNKLQINDTKLWFPYGV